ncbi:uncharacterized protein ATC70_004560 [Mucor velutinosus]|uniref:Uncharacterized protein n=1 Tax=Mucor velutinosus TaxID=708070 RepID=A0AAN7I550_9FUNG|nr:hypothetical protein ATC70_004560 [Mucor velutinosus]
MDFSWVSDIPTNRKCLPNTSTNNTNSSSLNQSDAAFATPTSRTAGSRLSYTPPSSSHSNMNDTTNTSVDTAVRRSRAGTMPSSTLPPFMGLGSSNLYIAQQRPNHNRTNSMNTSNPAMYSRSGMSSPLDENASNSIASTLASLGLHDDPPMADSNNNGRESSTSTSTTALNHSNYFEPVTRNRAFTVSSRNTMTDNHRPQDMMSFSPFPQQHQKMPTRPRAISLGMMDSPLTPPPLQQQQLPFLPFDMNYPHHPPTSDYQSLGSTNSNLTDDHGNNSGNTSLPLLYHQSRLFARMDSHEEEEGDGYRHDVPSRLSSPHNDMEPPAQTPSRALWLGNVNPSLSVPDLHKMFARYGHVESARILSDKECAFVNFENVESALAAKEDLVNRLESKVAGSVVKVGFGKADVSLAMALTQEAGPNAQGPTRALWVGNIPANINPAILRSLFQSFGSIESIRILSHKNCGFVNFERQEDAVRARKQMQNKEILGPGTGTVRIGFAKAPTNSPDEIIQDVVISGNTVTSYATPAYKSSLESSKSKAATPSPSSSLAAHKSSNLPQDESAENAPNTSQWATVILMASMMMNAQKQQNGASTPTLLSAHPSPSNSTSSASSNARLASERKMIMQQLGYEPPSDEYERTAINYFSSIPAVPEFDADRHLGPMRLREIKKALDNGQGLKDVDSIAYECMSEIVELCSDYIGNTVVQKLFEHCGNDTKLVMVEKIAPYLASIGIHKNGTWAAQKIIDTASTDQQIQLICTNIAPYVPLLLLDQFGNYVVQCCLRMGPPRNQYIFDAIVDQCWEIGQGRFGARAVRAILENPIVTKDQQIYVAAAIMQNALLLTTNANGSILLNWLLDTSGLLGHYRALCNIN